MLVTGRQTLIHVAISEISPTVIAAMK